MSGFGRPFLCDHYIFAIVAFLAVILAIPHGAFAWGREGHQIIVIVAEHYMRPQTAARMRELLAPETRAATLNTESQSDNDSLWASIR
jgi:hypothetical protein